MLPMVEEVVVLGEEGEGQEQGVEVAGVEAEGVEILVTLVRQSQGLQGRITPSMPRCLTQDSAVMGRWREASMPTLVRSARCFNFLKPCLILAVTGISLLRPGGR